MMVMVIWIFSTSISYFISGQQLPRETASENSRNMDTALASLDRVYVCVYMTGSQPQYLFATARLLMLTPLEGILDNL